MEDKVMRSRRALLAAAAGGAAAAAATTLARPGLVKAADGGNVVIGAANSGTLSTTLDAPVAGGTALGVVNSAAAGTAVKGTSAAGGTGINGTNGDATGAPADTSLTGVFGYAATALPAGLGAGVWGDSEDIGSVGTGAIGVYGNGGVGVYGDGGVGGTGVVAESNGGIGLEVIGKVKLTSRSGRFNVASGRSSASRNVPGMTATSVVIAVLQTRETGTWVRAAVPAAGKFTVYFNRALPSSSVVGWIVLNG